MHTTRPGKFAARFAVTLSMIIWGTGVVITKIAVAEMAPILMATLRFGIAAVIFVPFSIKKGGLKSLPWGRLALSSFIGVTLYYILFNLGVLYTSAAAAGLLQGVMPVYTMLLAWLLLKEEITTSQVAGVICSILGVAVLVLVYDDPAGGSAPLLGNILVILSDLCFTIYLLISKVLLQKHPQHTVTAGNMFFGFLFLIPFAVAELFYYGFKPISLKCWFMVLYMGIVSSGVATALWNYSLTGLASTEAGLFANLCPVIATITAVCVLGEGFSIALVAGGILILGGVFIASRKTTQSPVPQRESYHR